MRFPNGHDTSAKHKTCGYLEDALRADSLCAAVGCVQRGVVQEANRTLFQCLWWKHTRKSSTCTGAITNWPDLIVPLLHACIARC